MLERAIEAHGGWDAYRALDELAVTLRCGGIALPSRGQPRALAHVDARVRMHEPLVRFCDWPVPGRTGVSHRWETRIEGGPSVEERRGRRRRLIWDELSVMHFAGYALWNYMTTPFLLAAPGVEVSELSGRRLSVRFPNTIPTHSSQQTFYLDEQNRIVRLDYTARVFGSWARAAHTCERFEWHEGLLIPMRRRVVPRGPAARALPGPTLVSIAIDSVQRVPSSHGGPPVPHL